MTVTIENVVVQIILGEGRDAPEPIDVPFVDLLPDSTPDNYDNTALIRAAEVYADQPEGSFSGRKVVHAGGGHILISPPFELG